MASFWEQLPRPFFVQAPLANVTDAAFRRLIAHCGKPDVMFTEFVSADGLFLGERDVLMKDLVFSDNEHPIVAQFFTSKPELMERAATLAVELGFDGVDINMGCPDRSVEGQGAGASLIKNPALTKELIQAAKQGAGELPVSVKTRLGYNHIETETWVPVLLEEHIAALTLHARTRKEMSKVPAHWKEVGCAVALRNELSPETLIVGNGGLLSLEDAKQKIKETGADGMMLGKAIFGNPCLFSSSQEFKNRHDPVVREKLLECMVEHTKLFEELLPHKNFAIMKKHYKAYVNGWDGAKELRMQLMEAENAGEVEQIVSMYRSRTSMSQYTYEA